jgi:prepilin-type N-terminal cleavage/methylation domain-containing protein
MKRLEKGFTLIELMIVVAIIGILAAIGAPKFGDQIKKAKDGKALATIQTWGGAANLFYADKLNAAENFGDLVKYVDDKTLNTTFEYVDGGNSETEITSGSSVKVAVVEAGTGVQSQIEGKNVQSVRFNVTTDGAIVIDEDSNKNTIDEDWKDL